MAIFHIFHLYFPETGLITGSFTLDLIITMFVITYASDMLALLVSCIARTTTAAMTIMPFLLVVQLVFAGGIFPLEREGAKILSQFTISHWGIQAVNVAADYNSQKSIALTAAIDTMQDSSDELIVRVHDALSIPELQEKIQTYTAEKLQDPDYVYEKENLLKCWGILLGFAAVYALVGLVFLEMVDRDKR